LNLIHKRLLPQTVRRLSEGVQRQRPSILEATHFEHDKNQALERQDGFPDN
jgi:hypothetical protein